MTRTVPRITRRQVIVRSTALVGLAACDRLVLSGATGELSAITSNDLFYITSCCGTPSIDTATWSMTIADPSGTRATIDMAWLETLTTRDKEHTLQCIGSGPTNQKIGNTVWSGLTVLEILDALGVSVPESAVELKFTGADGYTTSIPVSDLDTPIWLVWRMNGEPLPEAHGTTVRLLNPGRYGTKNPKWITAMEFIDAPYEGYWESRGWSNSAEYRPNAFIVSPPDGASERAGDVRIAGTAFAGSDPVARVEVSTDGGASFTDAVITYANGPDIWALWSHDFSPAAGEYTVRVRITTESGAMDSGDPEGTDPLGGYDGGMEIRMTVL